MKIQNRGPPDPRYRSAGATTIWNPPTNKSSFSSSLPNQDYGAPTQYSVDLPRHNFTRKTREFSRQRTRGKTKGQSSTTRFPCADISPLLRPSPALPQQHQGISRMTGNISIFSIAFSLTLIPQRLPEARPVRDSGVRESQTGQYNSVAPICKTRLQTFG